MPALTIADLFEFEGHFEDPMANYFANVNTTWQILTPRTLANVSTGTDILRTPRLLCEFHVTGSGIQRETQNNFQYYADRMGQIILSVVTQRANVSQSYGLMRGAVREAMLERTQLFNANTLPYYQVSDIRETASTQTPSELNDEIMTQLTFETVFFVPPTGFP